MDKELKAGEIGAEAKYVIEIVGSDAKISVDYAGKQASGGAYVQVGIVELLRAAAAKTENKVDDNLVEMVALALG